jgi:hypothetical protein
MRRLLLAATLALVLLAAPFAAAADGSSHGRSEAASGHEGHASAKGAGHGHGPGAILAAFHDRYAELMASWHENVTKVRVACHADAKPSGDNATGHGVSAWAHCLRDGLRQLRMDLLAQRKDARDAAADARSH